MGEHLGPRLLVVGMGWFPDQPGGLTRYLRNLPVTMAAQDDRLLRAVVLGPVAEPPAWVRAVGEQDQPLPLRWARIARAAGQEARDAELVDSHFALYAFPCLFVPAFRRLPLVVHFHGPWADEFVANGQPPGWRIELKRRLERYVYRRAEAIVVLSEAFKQIVVDGFGIPAARVHVLGAGVDLDAFSPADGAGARSGLDVAPSTWVGVTARRLDPRMGVDVLLRAWAEIDHPDRLLLVVGEGPARTDLELLVAELGLGGVVRFVGRVDDATLVTCYRAADVSLVPSLALEGFGLVVLEALACGTPVVTTDSGGTAEVVGRLAPGLVVPAGDVSALSSRLADAISGARPLPGGTECRRFAEAYSWPEVVERHRQLYRQLLA
ncbi:glycosyltransferase family 4 protein [soil metagenome]